MQMPRQDLLIAPNTVPSKEESVGKVQASEDEESSQKLALDKFQVQIPEAIATLNASQKLASLPKDYEPGEYDILSGRGKGKYNSLGNRRLRRIVESQMDRYQAASTSKADKSKVLQEILDRARFRECVDPTDGSVVRKPCRFVKLVTNKDGSTSWCELGEVAAREKVGHAMREAIVAHGADKKDISGKRQESPSLPPTNAKRKKLNDSTVDPSVESMMQMISIPNPGQNYEVDGNMLLPQQVMMAPHLSLRGMEAGGLHPNPAQDNCYATLFRSYSGEESLQQQQQRQQQLISVQPLSGQRLLPIGYSSEPTSATASVAGWDQYGIATPQNFSNEMLPQQNFLNQRQQQRQQQLQQGQSHLQQQQQRQGQQQSSDFLGQQYFL